MATPEDPPEATVPGRWPEAQGGERPLKAEQCAVVERNSPRDGYSSGGTYSEKRRLPVEEHAAARLPAETIEKY